MKQYKESISITLDEDILKEIRELAEYERSSVSHYINIILKKHLENIQTKSNKK